MKRNDRFFSRSRKNKPEPMGGAPAFAQPPVAQDNFAPAVETVVTGHALLFTGAPEPMPIVDDQLFLSVPPQGGLVISPQCVGEPLLVIWKSGEDWLARRLWQGKLLLNGIETVGDDPILLWDGVCLELVGMSAFTFQEIREPVKKEEPPVQAAPAEEVPPVKEEAPAAPAPFDWAPFFPAEEPENAEKTAPAEEPVPAAEPDPIPMTEPAYVEKPPFDWTPFFPVDEPETAEPVAPAGEPVPAAEPEVIPMTEPIPVEKPPFDWTPFFPVDEPETAEPAVPAEEPEVIEEPVPEEKPPFDWTPFFPVDEPETAEPAAPAEEPEVIEEPAPEEKPPFDWTPFFPADEPETAAPTVLVEEPETAEDPIPITEPIPAKEPPFDWTPFFPVDEPEVNEEPVPVAEPEVIEEPVPVAEPEVTEEPVPVAEPEIIEEPVPVAEPEIIEEPVPAAEPEVIEEPVFVAAPVQPEPATPREALVLALEQLASGDWEAIQRLPGLLEQVDLYCWGGFNFMGVYIQPIPAVRSADWSGDADSLDDLGWEPRPGMVIPVFTCEEEAVKRNCPLGAFPSCSAAGLFARFAEMGLDLELDPFGERPVWVPAGAVRALSKALGGGAEKFRWIRRTLPW